LSKIDSLSYCELEKPNIYIIYIYKILWIYVYMCIFLNIYFIYVIHTYIDIYRERDRRTDRERMTE
jgi:hypothetical protein